MTHTGQRHTACGTIYTQLCLWLPSRIAAVKTEESAGLLWSIFAPLPILSPDVSVVNEFHVVLENEGREEKSCWPGYREHPIVKSGPARLRGNELEAEGQYIHSSDVRSHIAGDRKPIDAGVKSKFC
jgi:hypothetical protein